MVNPGQLLLHKIFVVTLCVSAGCLVASGLLCGFTDSARVVCDPTYNCTVNANNTIIFNYTNILALCSAEADSTFPCRWPLGAGCPELYECEPYSPKIDGILTAITIFSVTTTMLVVPVIITWPIAEQHHQQLL